MALDRVHCKGGLEPAVRIDTDAEYRRRVPSSSCWCHRRGTDSRSRQTRTGNNAAEHLPASVCCTVHWIDSDTIQLQNGDELMNVPLKPRGIACAVDHEVFPDPSEHVRLRMLQTGVFVLRPSLETYEMIKAQLGKVESVDGSDQGFLTSYYALSSFDNVCFLSSAYNYMKRGLKRHPQFDLSEITILHYVGHPKPWNGGEPGYEQLQRLWDLT